jgi:hypothetical protein
MKDALGSTRPSAAVVFYALCATLALLVLLDRASPEPQLAPGAVAADRTALAQVARRLVVDGPEAQPTSLVLTFGSRCGSISGVARGAGPDFLWFTIQRRPGLFQDPQRREVPTVLLARNTPAGSSLVGRGTARRIAVSLSPEVGDQSDAQLGTVDNVRGGLAAATVSGWGFDFAWQVPHCELTERDLRAMTILARLWSVRAPGGDGPVVTRVWREAAPRHLGFAVAIGERETARGTMRLRYRPGAVNPSGLFLDARATGAPELELVLEAGTAFTRPMLQLGAAAPAGSVAVDLEPILAAMAWRE